MRSQDPLSAPAPLRFQISPINNSPSPRETVLVKQYQNGRSSASLDSENALGCEAAGC